MSNLRIKNKKLKKRIGTIEVQYRPIQSDTRSSFGCESEKFVNTY